MSSHYWYQLRNLFIFRSQRRNKQCLIKTFFFFSSLLSIKMQYQSHRLIKGADMSRASQSALRRSAKTVLKMNSLRIVFLFPGITVALAEMADEQNDPHHKPPHPLLESSWLLWFVFRPQLVKAIFLEKILMTTDRVCFVFSDDEVWCFLRFSSSGAQINRQIHPRMKMESKLHHCYAFVCRKSESKSVLRSISHQRGQQGRES